MELLQNKLFDKKERMKTFLRFQHWEVSNSGDTTASINNANSIGSTQEYTVSLYISKMNLSVGAIHVNLVIYPLRQPYWNWSNPIYKIRYLRLRIAASFNQNQKTCPYCNRTWSRLNALWLEQVSIQFDCVRTMVLQCKSRWRDVGASLTISRHYHTTIDLFEMIVLCLLLLYWQLCMIQWRNTARGEHLDKRDSRKGCCYFEWNRGVGGIVSWGLVGDAG